MKIATIKELSSILMSLKNEIGDDYRVSEHDTIPGMIVTFATDGEGWSVQTGDNSYTGNAYGYPHWSVQTLYRRSNCKDIAKSVISDWNDYLEDWS